MAVVAGIAFFVGRGAPVEMARKETLDDPSAVPWGSTGRSVVGLEDSTRGAEGASPEMTVEGQKSPATRDAGDRGSLEGLADLIEKVEPSVVCIETTSRGGGGILGSGFVVDQQGTIITNNHVLENATSARVVFYDGTKAIARGLLSVPGKDLAVLQVDCPNEKLTPIAIATSLPRKGEEVVAIGSPHGFSGTASEGIVSAIRLSSEVAELGGFDLRVESWLQTTAPISPGNSGGPLINMKGEVVGVNTWCDTGGQNLNFAVSSIDVLAVLADLSRRSVK